MVQDQKELSTAFQHNQHRANKLRDPSILPDLCASHQSQMQVMLQNHQKIRDHRKIIARAKDELGGNLATRLKRIVCIENAMSDFDNRLLFYLRCLRRAERHVQIIEQIHQAPGIYVAAVTEVVRRKIFSGEFRLWASKLAEDFDSIHKEEVKRRELFNASFEGHFLNILFPGMNDMPPAFANETPLVFDARLPNLTHSDIDVLTTQLPDLAAQIVLPEMGPVINFFVSRSGQHQKDRMEQLLMLQIANNQGLAQKEQEAAGETELEKTTLAVTNTMARSTITEPPPLLQSAETLTEETSSTAEAAEQAARAEVERLRAVLSEMSQLALRCLHMAREQLHSIRGETTNIRDSLQTELQVLQEKCQLLRMQVNKRDQEVEELRKTLLERNENDDKRLTDMQSNYAALESEVTNLRAQLEHAHAEKQKAVEEAREALINEHKTEIEALRCRFKLMTSMESTLLPTDAAAVEKSSDSINLEEHEAILNQLKVAYDNDKERAVTAALEAERSLWQMNLLPLNTESVMANVSLLREMLEEKERQLEQLRECDLIQTKENYQLKTRLDALTNEEGNSWMKEKIEFLNRDKCRLEEELNMERSRRLEMESSVAAMRCSTTTISSKSCSSSQNRCISIDSCNKGDIVLAVWSLRHGQYLVVQDSSSLYFVHGDSLAALNLHLPPTAHSSASAATQATAAGSDLASSSVLTVTGALVAAPVLEVLTPIPMPYYAIARVVDKEYCAARKNENRYRVPKGTRFYRIKLAPITMNINILRRERMEPFCIYFSSINRPLSQCEALPQESISRLSSAVPTAMIAQSLALTTPITSIISTISSAKAIKDVEGTSEATSPTALAIVFKERTISVTSVNTDDGDEPLSLLSDGGGGSSTSAGNVACRYLSVSEEEEEKALNLQEQQQQSVITEQPTASGSRCCLDSYLMLASSAVLPQKNNLQQHEIIEQQLKSPVTTACTSTNTSDLTATMAQQQEEQQQTENTCDETDNKTETVIQLADIVKETLTWCSHDGKILEQTQEVSTSPVTQSPTKSASLVEKKDIAAVSPVHQAAIGPLSIATTSEDSDEYRSLEPKDDSDFPTYSGE